MRKDGSLQKHIMNRKCLLFIMLPLQLLALQKEPWLGDFWEFELDSAYTLSRYHTVSKAKKPLKHPANDHLIYIDLGVAPSVSWAVDVDFELVDTPRRPFGFQSAALQYRYQWLDDISGDPLSVTTGLSFREVFSKSVRDINCPYHSYANAEINLSLGKEWADPPFWKYRSYLFTALGMANRGSPWARARFVWGYNHKDQQQWELFAEGYFGFGQKQEVNIDHFHGYASIRHQSIDAGIAYRYFFTLWGSLGLEYAYRLYAHSFPAHVNFFTVRYQLPFSLF
jgi:hypothetical protein